MSIASTSRKKGSLDRVAFAQKEWKRGFAGFHDLWGKPLGWMYFGIETAKELARLTRKSCCEFYADNPTNATVCEAYLKDKAGDIVSQDSSSPKFFTCHAGKACATFPVNLVNGNKGAFIACNVNASLNGMRAPLSGAFHSFLKSRLQLVHQNQEITNYQENVHPRAAALSMMHAVHRVVLGAETLNELLPKIGRLSMQMLKAKNCSVWMVDEGGQYISSRFCSWQDGKKIQRKRIGRGTEGRVAAVGEIVFSRNKIAMPFIDHDVIGLIMLHNKVNGEAFTLTDLEIFKIFSEQTVAAIRNACLIEEKKKWTQESIKSIHQLMHKSEKNVLLRESRFHDLTRKMGIDLKMNSVELRNLEQALTLMDAGYAGLPEEIVRKKDKLTPREYQTIKQHPHRAVNAIKSIASLKPVIPLVLHHHERWDGKGYPKGLKSVQIPLGARILAVVDTFAAMVSERPWKSSCSSEAALEEIVKHSGSQFDPAVVRTFKKYISQIDSPT